MHRTRSMLAVILLALGALLAPLALVATWTSNLVGNSDRYVETVSPLAQDPAVQDAIVGRITAEVLTYVDVQALADDAVSALAARDAPSPAVSALRALGPALADQVSALVRQRVEAVVRSDAFSQAWAEANRAAHEQLVVVLTGESEGVRVGEEGVSVDLAAFIATVRADLLDRGFAAAARIPDVPATFTVVWPADIIKAQRAFVVLDRTSAWLPFVALGLLSAGVLAGRRRRRGVVAAGLGVAASMLLLAVGLAALRPVYLDAVPLDLLTPAAAAAVFDTLLRFLRDGLRVVLLAALLVAGVAALGGSSSPAVAIRRTWLELAARLAPRVSGDPLPAQVPPQRSAAGADALAAPPLDIYLIVRPAGATSREREVIDLASRDFVARYSPDIPTQRLAVLDDLHERGKLTDEELGAEKARVLNISTS